MACSAAKRQFKPYNDVDAQLQSRRPGEIKDIIICRNRVIAGSQNSCRSGLDWEAETRERFSMPRRKLGEHPVPKAPGPLE